MAAVSGRNKFNVNVGISSNVSSASQSRQMIHFSQNDHMHTAKSVNSRESSSTRKPTGMNGNMPVVQQRTVFFPNKTVATKQAQTTKKQ